MTLSSSFPHVDLIPKKETNALMFRTKLFPNYDGRNVVIGILDTGVDPGASGLQYVVKSDGVVSKPKVIDTIDCTGSGDVDVSTKVTATWMDEDENNNKQDPSPPYWEVTGLTGRTLKLNPNWNICPFPKSDEEEKKEEEKKGENEKGGDKQASTGKAEEIKTTTTEDSKKDDSSNNKKQDQDNTTSKRTCTIRLGVKRAYELFPKQLTTRLKSHRRKRMQASLEEHIVQVRNELSTWQQQQQYQSSNNDDTKKPTPAQVRIKQDLQARLDVLTNKDLMENDPGPLYDVVVYFDGTNYRAVVDIEEDGNLLSIQKGMTDFHKELQWNTFGTIDQYNYAVNFYQNGKVLSIVCDAGAHGTHVAGIAAAAAAAAASNINNNNTDIVDNDDIGGVAPGAQIVALKIGDTRLGAMETGTSLIRALLEAIRLKCDVINLSYGEGCVLPNRGKFIKLAEELVYKYHIVFVSSAGNNGPALSTVGAPGGTSSAILGVAAYVSPAMMEAEYSMMTTTTMKKNADGKNEDDSSSSPTTTPSLQDDEEQQQNDAVVVGTTYTWSSVGPTVDGDVGVNVTAPGGAITCVPNWTLQKSQLMNGTSMSSPHATGCVALLISACKAEGIPITPSRIQRALENTAQPMDNLSSLQQGWGMIQVDKAWEYLVANKDRDSEDVHFDVCIDNRSGSPRGVYLRQPDEVAARQTLAVNVNPKFRQDDVELETQRRRIEFEMHFEVKTTESWVSAPDHFMLMHNGRSFKIEVDPTKLPPGVHTAKVLASDAAHPDRGVLFSVPVTVAKPLEEKPHIALGELEFQPAEVKRYFLSVPAGATWMDVTVRDCRDVAVEEDSSSRLVVLHSVQLLPHAAYRDAEVQKYFNLLPGQTTVTSIPVHAGITCEVDLARYWSAVGSTKVDVSIQFRGIQPVPDVLQMTCGGGGSSVRISSHLRDELVNPSAKLTKWKTPVIPKSEGLITPLGDRDVLPSDEKRIYQLVLTYEFKQEEAGSITPRAPAVQGVLYESAYESQLMLIFDNEKKYLGVADAWPGEVKVPKGTITIRMQIRHDNVEMLEKLKGVAIWIERKMEKDVALSAYASKESMMIGKDSLKKRTLRKGTFMSVFFAEPESSKIPAGCKCGDVLFGTAYFAAGETALPGDGKRPGGYPISFLVGPKTESSKSKEEGTTPEVPDERTVQEKLDEAVRKLKVEQLEKLTSKEKDAEKFDELCASLEKEYPDYIPLLTTALKHYDTSKTRKESLEKVVQAADKVLQQIPEEELALHFGKNHDKEDPKSCKENKDMEEKKTFLVEALARKARAVSEMETTTSSSELFDSVLKKLKSWIDIDASHKYAVLVLEREKRAGRYGAMLKLLNALLKNKGEDTKGGICPMTKSDLFLRRAEVLQELGYTGLVEHDKKWRCISSPKDFALF